MARTTYAIGEVKAGHIRPYYGLLANIPTGWVLCDGTNGTPDLREVYPKGAAAGVEAGATGGALIHTHTNHPALSHSGGAVGAIAGSGASAVKIGTAAANAEPTAHTHPAPSFTQPSQHAAQSHNSPNHEPPFKTCQWIMKT